MDGNIPQHYEIKQVGGQQTPQEKLDKQVQVEQERQKQIIEEIQRFLIQDGSNPERVKELIYGFVGNIVAVTNKEGKFNFFKYSKETGLEYYTNPNGLEKDTDILLFGKKHSGYNLKDGKLFKNGQEIPQFLGKGEVNPEFVKGIDIINFYSEIQNTFGLIKSIVEGEKIEIDAKSLYFSILSGVVRIKEVMYFYSKGYIPEKDFERLLVRAIQELPNQCSDTRFYQTSQGIRMGMEVTKSELDEYLKPTKGTPLITQKMYDDCLRRIEARDRKINEMNGVKEGTKGEIKVEKTRNGFVDRVKGILGF